MQVWSHYNIFKKITGVAPRSVGSNANTVEDCLRGPDHKVMRGIQAGIDAANRQAVSNAQRIQKWMILPRDFSLPGGEMGPTMKVS